MIRRTACYFCYLTRVLFFLVLSYLSKERKSLSVLSMPRPLCAVSSAYLTLPSS